MSTDYQAVQKALSGGADPSMLCATCPWDRNCVTPPAMTSADIDQYIAEAGRADEQRAAEAKAAGKDPGMPTGTIMAALVYSLRLRSSGGRKIADTFKAQMQEWDDQK